MTLSRLKKLLLLVACCTLGVFSGEAAEADGGRDLLVEEESLEFDDAGDSELVFEDSADGEMEMVDDTGDTPSDSEASLLSDLLKPARFTARHEMSCKTESPERIVNNRSSFRVEYSRFFLDHFYIQFDAKLSAFWDNDHRAEAEEKDMFLETSSREAFLQVSYGATSVKLGSQVMIWGESDGGAITDVISPRDYSELFYISLEESRIGQSMLAVDQFSGIGQWTFFAIPDPEFNEYPEAGTAYFIDPFAGQAVFRDESGSEDLAEYGLRWKQTFGKSDVSIMAASLIDNDFSYRLEGLTVSGKMLFTRLRQRYTMAGTAFNYVTGSFLIKGEIGRKSPRAFNVTGFQIVEKDVLDTAVGLEYSPGGTYTLSLEFVNSHVDNWMDEILGVPEDSRSLVLVWSQTFLNDDLTVNWMTQMMAPYSATIHSLRTSYKWNDDITVYLDAFYPDVESEENDLWVYRDQKHLVLKGQYQF